jgi:pre-rRNA-processing protein TSR1
MSKFDRRNQARQKLQSKHREHLRDTSIFAGRDGAPRIVAVVPLCEDGDAAAVVKQLSSSLDMDADVPEEGSVLTEVERFKQKIQYIVLKRDLLSCMDACRVADFVLFILSPTQEVDDLGELIIRSVESQGLSTLLTVVQGLDTIAPPKRRTQVASSLKSYINHFHPEQEKVHSLDSRQESANLMRSLCTTTPKGVRWREDRSWMLIEDVQWPVEGSREAILTGVVRGKGLKADRLVQVGDWGDFQIEKITAAPSIAKKGRSDFMKVDMSDEEAVLDAPSIEQDDLAELAPEEIMMNDTDVTISVPTTEKRGVLLDDHHYFSDDETHIPAAPKRVPKGTSSYQAAWFLGDNVSDSGSDYDELEEQADMNIDGSALPQDGLEGFAPREPTEAAPTEYPQSEMFLDAAPDEESEQLAAFRARKSDEAEEDKEFPDEIELHPQVLARERLAKYRGLKSLRTSQWEEAEDKAYEPDEWRKLLQVPDYKSSRAKVTREALIGGVKPGTRVCVHLRGVPKTLEASYTATKPLMLFSLLRHEHKRAVLNFDITLSSDCPSPIRSKEELILQCGPRRFIINPIFSQAGTPQNNVHKFERFLHPGRSAIASFIGPLTWGSVPTLFFKRSIPSISSTALQSSATTQTQTFQLVATGTSLAPSSTRVIAKRIILTGHPYKIHKKLVTVRYMFFNHEDVEWFKALQLWTKRGRSGFVKESLGTHGYFKATFDGKINPQDAVGVSLYKRVWPRNARPWKPEEKLEEENMGAMGAGEVEMADVDMEEGGVVI